MKKKILAIIVMATLISAIPANISNAFCNHYWVLDQGASRDATCTTEGSQWYDCILCYDYKIVSVPATGVHNWTEWKADGALCKDGKNTRYCRSCYTEQEESRSGDGNHIWGDWIVTDSADCLNDGEKYRRCENCYEKEEKTIPSSAKYHDWSKWYVSYADHSTRRDCYVCKKSQRIKLSHNEKMLYTRGSFSLKVKKKPYGDKILGYYSSKKKVASVNKKGKVVAKKRGRTIITVKMKSGCKAKCTVTVI